MSEFSAAYRNTFTYAVRRFAKALRHVVLVVYRDLFR